MPHSILQLLPNHIANVPVSVMASNRGPYLFRMLRTLLSTDGANRSMIVVFIDGFFQVCGQNKRSKHVK